MGESNAVLGREAAIGRDVMLAAEGIYRELHGEDIDGRFSLPATFLKVQQATSHLPPPPKKKETGK